jgi:hypothetical protein
VTAEEGLCAVELASRVRAQFETERSLAVARLAV